jgi:DNA polymerase elongation subunit (family B)
VQTGIVAVEPDASNGSVVIYRREGAALHREVDKLQSWVLARKSMDDSLELAGPHPLRHYLLTSGGRAMEFARSLASDQRLAYQDPVTAHLCSSGETFYRGLEFTQLRRMQFDLETLDVYPDRESGEICLIGVTDSTGFERVLSLDEFPNEAALIAEFARLVRERDPDLLEGHNVFNFDLWYLAHRARRAGVPLIMGRDGRTPLWLDDSLRRSVPNGMVAKYYRIEGRQIIDTFYGVMRWDVARRLPNYKLKQVVRHLGIGDDARTMVNAANMRALWADPAERAKLKAYCLDDARDTARLSALVTPSEFHQAQMVPESLQGLAFVGIGGRIERLMVRGYLAARHSIPRPRAALPIEGALTAAFETGVFHEVVKCDVESLYPSLMLSRGIAPQDDDVGAFLPMLRELRDLRLQVKRRAEEAVASGTAQAQLAADGLQQAFKILVNSFFGFLGTNNLHFNDPAAAARVTEAGREVLETIVAGLRGRGARVIEADTDGAFFTLPPGADALEVVDDVGSRLGGELRLVGEERYESMLSLTAKNYALRRKNGTVVLRGSALRSARDELFGRIMVTDIAIALMDGKPERTLDIVRSVVEKVRLGTLSIEEFSRRESITPKTFSSPANRRLANALAERGLVVGDKVRVYQRASGELALAEEYAGDEDREYLLRRVADFVARFGDLLPLETRAAASDRPDQLSLL